MAVFTLQPYQLDIPVTWACMPSRDEYLAAKIRTWSRDADAMPELPLTSASSAGSSHEHVERPFVAPAASAVHTLEQRRNYFRDMAAGLCDLRSKMMSFSRNLIARGSPVDMRNTLRPSAPAKPVAPYASLFVLDTVRKQSTSNDASVVA